jgi:hypothetical protein
MAGINLSIQSNVGDIRSQLAKFSRQVIQQAAPRAINKTMMQARTQAVKEVRSAGYNIKASTVRKTFKLQRSTKSCLTAVLTSSGKPIALIDYGAKQTKSGVSVVVKNGRKVLRHAFLAKMRSGHVGVFQRTGKGHRTVMRNGVRTRTGLPVGELFGPSVPTALSNQAVQEAVRKLIASKFPLILEHELQFASLRK